MLSTASLKLSHHEWRVFLLAAWRGLLNIYVQERVRKNERWVTVTPQETTGELHEVTQAQGTSLEGRHVPLLPTRNQRILQTEETASLQIAVTGADCADLTTSLLSPDLFSEMTRMKNEQSSKI